MSKRKGFSNVEPRKSIFSSTYKKKKDETPQEIDMALKQTARAVLMAPPETSKFTKLERQAMERMLSSNADTFTYPLPVSEETHGLIFRRYLESVILPSERTILPCFVKKTDRTCCRLDPDLVDSVTNYENKKHNLEELDISEIPLVFVLINNTGHSSLFIISGTINEEVSEKEFSEGKRGEYIPQKIFSIGLLQTGEETVGRFARATKTIGVDISKVIIVSPDPTINPFGTSKSGMEWQYNIVEIQILTTQILNNMKQELDRGIERDTIYGEIGSSIEIETGEPYCMVSSEIAPGITGRNCSQFTTTVLPNTTGSAYGTSLSVPGYIRSTTRPLNDAQIRQILNLASTREASTTEFYNLLDNTRPVKKGFFAGKRSSKKRSKKGKKKTKKRHYKKCH